MNSMPAEEKRTEHISVTGWPTFPSANPLPPTLCLALLNLEGLG